MVQPKRASARADVTSAGVVQDEASRRIARPTRATRQTNGLEAITGAAREIFATRGYHGTSVRDIATRAGVSLSALYYWHASKQDLLAALLAESRQDYVQGCRAAVDAVPDDDPAGRLSALVAATVRYRVRRQADSELANREWRHLEQPHIDEMQALQIAASELWDGVMDLGVRSGVFTCDFPDDSRRTIQAACNAISQWYDPAGSIDVDDLADRYVAIALRLVQPATPGPSR